MTFNRQTLSAKIPFPAKETPTWAAMSDRWYQLDQPGYSLPQAFTLLKEDLGALPDLILLASPQASNPTDRDFARSGANSPSKFVHTLPNIRAVSLLQAMEWSGPLLCVQNDPSTLESAVEEAELELETKPELKRIWVISFNALESEVSFTIVARA